MKFNSDACSGGHCITFALLSLFCLSLRHSKGKLCLGLNVGLGMTCQTHNKG